MSDLLQGLIEAEKAAMVPSVLSKQSTWAALEVSITAGVAPPIDVALGAKVSLGWFAGIIGSAGGVLVIAYLAVRPAVEVSPVVPSEPPPPPPVVEAVPPEPQPAIPEVVRKQVRRKARPSQPLAVQLAELRKAQLAFSRGNSEQALELVAMHRAKFPATPLEQERSALEVLAGCRLKRGEASKLAREFLEKWPRSPQADRVRGACSE